MIFKTQFVKFVSGKHAVCIGLYRVVSIHYEHAKFVRTQKAEIFQLSFTALFPSKSEWILIIFDVILYLFSGAHFDYPIA